MTAGQDDDFELEEGGTQLDPEVSLSEEEPQATPVVKARAATGAPSAFVRAANEDDDGYDPYSDRPAPREPLFERDPWS